MSVFLRGMSIPAIVREKNNSNWCVSELDPVDVPESVRDRINDVLTNQDADKSNGYDKIPEKYLNFNKTTVKFACKKEGRKLLPVDDAILYCYLPAKRADWGFRSILPLLRCASRQFFYWIKSLIESGQYELDSIFALIPDFDECKKKRQYKTFIE